MSSQRQCDAQKLKKQGGLITFLQWFLPDNRKKEGYKEGGNSGAIIMYKEKSIENVEIAEDDSCTTFMKNSFEKRI